MKTLERIDEWIKEPAYSRWKQNEIIRPVTLGFYIILLMIIGVYIIISFFPS